MKKRLQLALSIAIILGLQLISLNSSAQICFGVGSPTQYSGFAGAYDVVTGDFNSDGNPDFICANYNGSNVIVRLGNGNGTFAANVSYAVGTVGTTNPKGLSAIDVNGDSKLDLVVSDYMTGNVFILLGVGNGTFGAATMYTAGAGAVAAAGADFNGDGKVDLAVAAQNQDSVAILLGNGLGGFGTPTLFEAGHWPSEVVCKDFNSDGRADVAVMNNGTTDVSILIGNGSGGFSPQVSFPIGSAPHDMTWGDFNVDGNIDLVTTCGGSNLIVALMGNGSGGFSTNYISTAFNNYGITTADYNADGKIDIGLADYGPNRMEIMLGDNTGNFTPIGSFGGILGPNSIASADFNLDGKPDVVVSLYSSNKVAVYISSPAPTVSANVNPSNVVCAGTSLTLYGSGTATNYSWTGGVSDNNSFSASTSQSYTVTGTNAVGCTNTSTISVTVNQLPTVNPTQTGGYICQNSGDSTLLAANNSIGSTCNWNGGLSFANSFYVKPNTPTTYTVIATDAFCSSNPGTVTVQVYTVPTITASATATSVCLGTSVTLSGVGLSIPAFGGFYSWTGGIADGVSFVPTLGTTTYTVTGTTSPYGCKDTASIAITANAIPTVTANATATTVCPGTNITLTGGGISGAANYSWTGSVNDGVGFVPATSGSYTVTGTDANNCSNTASISITVPVMVTPAICMVTVDSLSKNNLIIWDKTSYMNVDSFYVYRDTANNAFGWIGAVSKNDLSMFTDTVRMRYAANGDPSASSWRYKLAIKDTCGNISTKSPYHQSIFMQNNSGNFTWSEYKIEGQTPPVLSLQNYLFKRDNVANGNYITIQTLSASSTGYTDPSYATFQSTADWRIETQWSIVCNPSFKTIDGSVMAAINTSRSNIKTNRMASGIKAATANLNVVVYPNPAKDQITIELPSSSTSTVYELVNSIGQTILSGQITANQTTHKISTNGVSEGVYMLRIANTNGQTIKKVIIQ